MTILWGDTGRGLYGSLKTLNITPYIIENNVAATALPTAMPASPQYSVTINTTTMAPTLTGINVLSSKQVFGIMLAGQNTSGSTTTVYYQINKNGTLIKSGSTSVTNNYYFTSSLENLAVNGDKYDIYVWASAASGVNYFYTGCFMIPSSIDTGAENIANLTFTVDAVVNHLPLTGHTGSGWAGSMYVFGSSYSGGTVGIGATNINNAIAPGSDITFPLINISTPYKLFALQSGDVSGVEWGMYQHATNYPYICQNMFPSKIRYRDFLR